MIKPNAALSLSAVLIAASVAGASDPANDAFFESEVRPLLVERCLKCHGGEGKPKGGLRLDSRAAVLAGGDGGPAAVPGKPEESAILQAIRYRDEPKMPPAGKLTDREIAAFEKWIEIGLPWPEDRPIGAASTKMAEGSVLTGADFWSFHPVRPVDAPAVKDAAWPRNDIDRFLLSAMEAKGVRPATEADKRTWIRRVTFDLIGLPPSPADVEEFLKEDGSDSFEKVVDRLLDSPRYGERWGRHWLDLVRYADSLDARGVGGEGDIREAWRYRDWVVGALNADMPYDHFVTNQVAGDLLPNPSPSADPDDAFNAPGTIASTMLAIGNWGNGDADKEKILTDIADDQVDVVSRTFLGLTVACARCHDHKFDPISQKDYYGLAGIFFSTHILDRLAAKGEGERIRSAPLASKAALKGREAYQSNVAEAEKGLKTARDGAYRSFAAARRTRTREYLLAAWDFRHPLGPGDAPSLEEFSKSRGLDPAPLRRWIDRIGTGQVTPLNLATKDKLAPGVHAWEKNNDLPSAVANSTDAEVTYLTFKLPPKSISIHPSPSNPAVVTFRSPAAGVVRISGTISDADPVGGDGVAWSVEVADRTGPRPIASGDIPNGGKTDLDPEKDAALGSVALRVGDTIRLVVRPKANHGFDMTTVAFHIASADGSKSWDLTRDVLPDFLIADKSADRGLWSFGEIAAAAPADREFDSALADWRRNVGDGLDRAGIEKASDSFAAKFAIDDARSPFWIADPAEESSLPEESRKSIASAASGVATLKANPPPPLSFVNSAADGGVPGSPHAGVHDVKVHIRGRYDRLGEVVPRHFPEVIAGPDPPKIREGSGRVELARWLTRPENPLTARVFVNRVWQHHFGEGIVRTPSNFGKLGERPTHPELLDWLADRFVRDGWSIKRLHKLILLSAAYRQSCTPSSETLRLDADNRLFSRMNRQRLESEPIRDALLFASGKLDPSMGGPSIRDVNSPRRTIYLMMIRSTPYPFAPLFDTADPTGLVEKRTTSTVAPQALYLLNNPFVIEQSKAMARRILEAKLPGEKTRIDLIYSLLYARPPGAEEAEIGLRWLAGGGEEALASYCQVLLCSNEFLYID